MILMSMMDPYGTSKRYQSSGTATYPPVRRLSGAVFLHNPVGKDARQTVGPRAIVLLDQMVGCVGSRAPWRLNAGELRRA